MNHDSGRTRRLLVVAIETGWVMAGYRPETLTERLSSIFEELLVSSHRPTTLRQWLSSHGTDPVCFSAANSIVTEIMAHRLKPFEDCLVHAMAGVITAEDRERFKSGAHTLLRRVAETAGADDNPLGDWTAEDLEVQLKRELKNLKLRIMLRAKSPAPKESVRCSEVEMTLPLLRSAILVSSQRYGRRRVGSSQEYVDQLQHQNGQCCLTGVSLNPKNVFGILIAPDAALEPENFRWLTKRQESSSTVLALKDRWISWKPSCVTTGRNCSRRVTKAKVQITDALPKTEDRKFSARYTTMSDTILQQLLSELQALRVANESMATALQAQHATTESLVSELKLLKLEVRDLKSRSKRTDVKAKEHR